MEKDCDIPKHGTGKTDQLLQPEIKEKVESNEADGDPPEWINDANFDVKDELDSDTSDICLKYSDSELDDNVSVKFENPDHEEYEVPCEFQEEGDNPENVDSNSYVVTGNKILLGSKPSSNPESPDMLKPLPECLLKVKVVLKDCSVRLNSSLCYCKDCKTLFPTSESLKSHVADVHSSPDEEMNESEGKLCEHCNIYFDDQLLWIEHMYDVLKAKEKEVKESRKRKGDKVGNKRLSGRGRQVGKKSKRDGLIAQTDERVSETPDPTKEQEMKVYSCHVCSYYYEDQFGLKDHLCSNHGITEVGSLELTVFRPGCKFCERETGFESHNKHIEISHKEYFRKESNPTANDSEKKDDRSKSNAKDTTTVKSKIKFKTPSKKISKAYIPKDVLFRCQTCSVHFFQCKVCISHSIHECDVSDGFIPTRNIWTCPICKRKFRSKDQENHELQHLIGGNIRTYDYVEQLYAKILCRCAKCDVYFEECAFFTHNKEGCSNKKPPEKCRMCNVDVNNIFKHIERHKDYNLTKSDFILIDEFIKPPNLEVESTRNRIDESKMSRSKKRKNTGCPGRKPKVPKVQTLQDKYYNILYNCKSCNLTMDSYDDVIYHCQKHISIDKYKPASRKCKICSLKFEGACLNSHKEDGKRPIKILPFDYSDLLKDKWYNLFASVSKKRVKKIKSSSRYVTRAVKMDLILDGPPELTLYKCEKCRNYVDPMTVVMHSRCCDGKSGNHTCTTCGVTFNTILGLDQHRKIHDNSKVSINSYRIVAFNSKNDGDFDAKLRVFANNGNLRGSDTVNRSNSTESDEDDQASTLKSLVGEDTQNSNSSDSSDDDFEINPREDTEPSNKEVNKQVNSVSKPNIKENSSKLPLAKKVNESRNVTEARKAIDEKTVRTQADAPAASSSSEDQIPVGKYTYILQCYVCKSSSMSLQFIETHDECTEKEDLYKCNICDFASPARTSYWHQKWHNQNKHIKTSDIKIVPFQNGRLIASDGESLQPYLYYQCRGCKMLYLRGHFCHALTFQCKICNFTFSNHTFKSHMLRHQADSYFNKDSFIVVPKKPSKERYNPVGQPIVIEDDADPLTTNTVFKCASCKCIFLDRKDFCYHHKQRRCCSKNGIKCKSCGLAFHSKAIGMHKQRHKLTNDVNKMHDIVTLNKAGMKDYTLYKCNKCQIHFINRSTCSLHFTRNHIKTECVDCKVCAFTFEEHVIEMHVKLHHEIDNYKADDFYIICRDLEKRRYIKKRTREIAEKSTTSKISKELAEESTSDDITDDERRYYEQVFAAENTSNGDDDEISDHSEAFVDSTDTNIRTDKVTKDTLNDIEETYIDSEADLFEKSETLKKTLSFSDGSSKIENRIEKGANETKKIILMYKNAEYTNTLYKCRCGVHFLNLRVLEQHQKYKCSGKRVATCKFCSYLFSTISLNVHIRIHHKLMKLGAGDFNIVHNEYGIIAKTNVKLKMINTQKPDTLLDSNNTVFICTKCRMCYMTRDSLIIHFRNEHRVFSNVGHCEQCNLKFPIKSAKRHNYLHHKQLKYTLADLHIFEATEKDSDRKEIDVDDDDKSDDEQIPGIGNESQEDSDSSDEMENGGALVSYLNKTRNKITIRKEMPSIKTPEAVVTRPGTNESPNLEAEDSPLMYELLSSKSISEKTSMCTSRPNMTSSKSRRNSISNNSSNTPNVSTSSKKANIIHTYSKKTTVANSLITSTDSHKSATSPPVVPNLIVSSNISCNNNEIIYTLKPTPSISGNDEKSMKRDANVPLSNSDAKAKNVLKNPLSKIIKSEFYKIFKCAACNVHFIKQKSCIKHFSNHVPLKPCDYIECKLCKLQFQIEYLKKHVRKHHTRKDFQVDKVSIIEYRMSNGVLKSRAYRATDKVQSILVSTTKQDSTDANKTEVTSTNVDSTTANRFSISKKNFTITMSNDDLDRPGPSTVKSKAHITEGTSLAGTVKDKPNVSTAEGNFFAVPDLMVSVPPLIKTEAIDYMPDKFHETASLFPSNSLTEASRETLSCRYCSESFNSSRAKELHESLEHLDALEECVLCHKSFNTSILNEMHLSIQNREFTCCVCRRRLPVDILVRHAAFHSETREIVSVFWSD